MSAPKADALPLGESPVQTLSTIRGKNFIILPYLDLNVRLFSLLVTFLCPQGHAGGWQETEKAARLAAQYRQ